MLKRSTIGIDCGPRGAKVVAIRPQPGPAPVLWSEKLVVLGDTPGGVPARQMQEAVLTGKAARVPTLVNVPNDAAVARRVEVPAAPREKQRQMLALEVGEHLPFPDGSAVFDLASRGREASAPAGGPAKQISGLEQVLLVGAPDDAVVETEKWIAEAALRRGEVSAECVASARAAAELLEADSAGRARLLVNLSPTATMLTVADRELVLYARTALLGLDDAGREGSPAQDWARELVTEVRATLMDYDALEPGRPAAELVLCGEGAADLELVELIGSVLGLPVVLPPAPPGFSGTAEDFAPLLTAYGLALLAAEPPQSRVTLCSHRRVREAQQTVARRQRMALSLAAATLGLIVAALGTWAWQQDASNRAVLRQEVKILQRVERQQKTRLSAQQEVDQYVEQNTVSRQQRPWLQVIASVAEALPEDVWLTNLKARRALPLQAAGRSLSNAAVAEFVDSLCQRPEIAVAKLEYSRAAQVAQQRVVEFSILCELAAAAESEGGTPE